MIVVLAIIQQLIVAFQSMKWKELRSKGASPVSAYGLLCAGLPFWIITFIYLNFRYEVNYSLDYLKYVLLWAIPVIIANLGNLYLVKYHALSELQVYKLSFAALTSLIIDTLFFNTVFSYFMITGIIFLFISGVTLTKSKKRTKFHLHKALLGVLIITLIRSLYHVVFKIGVNLQPNPVIHGVLCQIILYSVFLIFSMKYLKSDFKQNIITKQDIAIFGVRIFAYTVIEAILFKVLPISIIILLSVLNLLIYSGYDIKKKEIGLSWKTYTAGVLTVIALILINF